MRLVHSYWSRPLEINAYDMDAHRLFGSMWLASLSVAYAKRIGAEIVLHTDTLGMKMFEHLPYDDIYLTLDDIPQDIHPRFWACGKIYAMQSEPLSSCHIDNDVFLKQPNLLEEIECNDIVVQEVEGERFHKTYIAEQYIFKGLPLHILKKYDIKLNDLDSVNCGCVRINNAVFKEKYINGYIELVKHISNTFKNYLDVESHRTPDLIAEQSRFKWIADSMDLPIHTLLSKNRIEDAIRKGYHHLQSSSKWSCLDKVKQTLEIINKDIYNKTYKLCRNI